MQAIITKTLPENENKPLRIKALCQRGSIIVSWYDPRIDHLTHMGDKHAAVARLLCDLFILEDSLRGGNKTTNPWSSPFVTGGLPTNASDWCFAHVFTS